MGMLLRPAASVRQVIPEAVVPAACGLCADEPDSIRLDFGSLATDTEDDLLREGMDTQTLYLGGGHQVCRKDAFGDIHNTRTDAAYACVCTLSGVLHGGLTLACLEASGVSVSA